jgi:hypothetical protein
MSREKSAALAEVMRKMAERRRSIGKLNGGQEGDLSWPSATPLPVLNESAVARGGFSGDG